MKFSESNLRHPTPQETTSRTHSIEAQEAHIGKGCLKPTLLAKSWMKRRLGSDDRVQLLFYAPGTPSPVTVKADVLPDEQSSGQINRSLHSSSPLARSASNRLFVTHVL